MAGKVYEVLPDPDWLAKRIAEALAEYNRRLDVRIMQLIGEGYACDQIVIQDYKIEHTTTGVNIVGAVGTSGQPRNLGKRHRSAT